MHFTQIQSRYGVATTSTPRSRPRGATGSRLVLTAANRLQRDNQKYALLAACADGHLCVWTAATGTLQMCVHMGHRAGESLSALQADEASGLAAKVKWAAGAKDLTDKVRPSVCLSVIRHSPEPDPPPHDCDCRCPSPWPRGNAARGDPRQPKATRGSPRRPEATQGDPRRPKATG